MDQELFGITPPKKLFVKLAIPSLVSMLFSSIYIMADGMFVGKIIGSKALAAINIVFPIDFMICFFLLDVKNITIPYFFNFKSCKFHIFFTIYIKR